MGAVTVFGLSAQDARVTTFIVEAYSDSGLTSLAASGAAPSVFDSVSGLALQVGTIMLTGLTNGSTYYLRSCSVVPAFGPGAWSATQTAVAGADGSSVMTGDSGSGGAAGLVPAPGAGDAAAGRFLKADGSWTAPPTTPGPTRGSNSYGYWVKDSGGYIRQWGSVATASGGGGVTVNFPIAYSNAASIAVTVTADFGQTSGATMDVQAGSVNTGYFTLINYGGTSGTAFWQSDGY